MSWSRALDALTSLIFPLSCEPCGKPVPSDSDGVCAACDASIPRMKDACPRCARPESGSGCADCAVRVPAFDAAFSPFAYRGEIRKILHAFKFEGRARLSRFLAAGMTAALPAARRFDAVVAVPLDGAKRRSRGFNQSALLARRLSIALGTPDRSEDLARAASPSAQSALSRAERRRNVEGRFRCRRRFDGLRVLLVDDVLTTGETASECARELKRAGAASVAVACAARASS